MISVVIPVYNEEESIKLLYDRLKKVLQELGDKYEIIFVDDGSPDESCKILEQMAKDDRSIRLIKFNRNYGQTAALQAGFQKVEGDIVVTLDADLQNNPEDIPRLIEELKNTDADLISGWRYPRKDPMLRRLVSRSANSIISKICGLKLHDYGCTLKVYKSRYVKDLNLFGEMHRLIPAFIHWNGGKVTEIKVTHSPRIYGKSAYGMERIHRVILDLVTTKFLTTYSTKPIYVFGTLGLGSIGTGVLAALYVLIRKIYFGGAWISPLFFVSVFLFGIGLLLILMGIIAEIMVRIYFSQSGNLPYKISEKD